ncbi:MAG: hypothetical protein J3K34DRAFT_457419 [Monoraphidium minutum]|nr:MAG: hypothetical protein J3K34DRAFT_457419 [Monoraphidium minutum]
MALAAAASPPGPAGLLEALSGPDGAAAASSLLEGLSGRGQAGCYLAEELMAWLLGAADADAPAAGGTRLALLPLQHQHSLVCALAAWLGAPPPQQQQQLAGQPGPPALPCHAADVLLQLAQSQTPGCGGVRAAAQLVLAALDSTRNAGAAAGGGSGGGWACGPGACYGPPGAAPMPAWLQRQSLLLAEATGSWGAGRGAAAAARDSAERAGSGAPGADDDPPRASSPKRLRSEQGGGDGQGGQPSAAVQPGALDALHRNQQQQRGAPGADAARGGGGDLLRSLARQLAALAESLDESAADWDLLRRPEAWEAAAAAAAVPAPAAAGGGAGDAPGGSAGEAAADAARAALASLSPDAAQLLCRRLVAAPAAPAALCGAVLRAAVLPLARGLAGAAPQPLMECLQMAARAQPALLLEAVLRPLLAAPDLRPPQAQAVAKLCKQEPGLRAGCAARWLSAG